MSDAVLKVAVDSDSDKAVADLRNVNNELQKTHESALKTGVVMAATNAAITGGFGVLANVAKSAFGGVGDGLIGMNSKLEQASIAFTTMLGSGEKANAFLQDMQQFAATTPFQFPELVEASKKMLAFGFTAEQVRPLLTAVGDAAAAMGTGKEGIDRITLALGQMQAKGKASGDEMMQLTEAGIPAWDMLAKKLGTDVAGAMDKVSKGTVSAATMITAFTEGTAARFGGMMDAQSHTFAGAMSTIQDSVGQLVGGALRPFFDTISHLADQIATFAQGETVSIWAEDIKIKLGQLAPTFETVGNWLMEQIPNAMSAAEAAAGGFVSSVQSIASAAPPVLEALGGLKDMAGEGIDKVRDLANALGPMGLGMVAAGAGATALIAALPALAAGFAAAGGASGILAAGLAAVTGPIGLAVLAAGALAAAWVTDFGGIREVTEQVVSGLQARLGELGNALGPTVLPALQQLGTEFSQTWGLVQEAATAAINFLLPKFDELGTALSTEIPPKLEELKAHWDDFWGNAGPLLNAFWNAAKPVLEAVGGVLATVVVVELQTMKTVWDSVWEGIKTTLRTVEPLFGAFADMLGGTMHDAAMAMRTALRDSPEAVAQAAGEVGKASGKALWQGFKEGAVPAAQELAATVEPAAGAVTELGKAAAGSIPGMTGLANAMGDGAEAAKKLAEAANAASERDLAEQINAVKEAALGGAIAIRDHEEALAREKEQALGGALAIRDHAEALAREKEASLGGALAIRDHEEALAREKETSLGGALAIRDHAEALEREKEASLGGALAVQAHADDLKREHDEALGGALGIRDHTEALARDEEAALGGAVAIRSHQEELNREKVAALGGYDAIYKHEQALAAETNSAATATAATKAHAQALTDLQNVAATITVALQHNTDVQVINTKAHDDYYRTLDPTIQQTKAFVEQLLREADAYDKLGKAEDADRQRRAALALTNQAGQNPFGQATISMRGSITPVDGNAAGESANAASQTVHAATQAALPAASDGGAQIGAAVADGIAQGLYNNAGTTKGAAEDVVLAALLAAKDALGISSPSQVMADQVGVPIAQGIGQGIQTGWASTRDGIKKYIGVDLNDMMRTAFGVGGPLPQEIESYWQGVWQGIENDMQKGFDRLNRVAKGLDVTDRGVTDAGAGSLTNSPFEGVVIGADDATGAVGSLGTAIQGLRQNSVTVMHDASAAVASFAVEAGNNARFMMQTVTADAARAQQAIVAALRAGQMVIAGQTTAVGLNSTQIYGNTASQGSGVGGAGGSGGFVPFNAYGLPVVSPVTTGTLRGYRDGGTLPEDIYGTGRSGQRYQLHQGETVVPAGQSGMNVTIVVQAGIGASDEVSSRPFWRKVSQDHLVPVLRGLGH